MAAAQLQVCVRDVGWRPRRHGAGAERRGSHRTQYGIWQTARVHRDADVELQRRRHARFRADLEKAEKGAGEFLKQAADQERADAGRSLTAFGDRLRTQIAVMTPEERSTPAWVIGLDLVEPGTPNAMAITRFNPAFYRSGTSSLEVRAILVHVPNVKEPRRSQREQMFREFDWAALKRLLSR